MSEERCARLGLGGVPCGEPQDALVHRGYLYENSGRHAFVPPSPAPEPREPGCECGQGARCPLHGGPPSPAPEPLRSADTTITDADRWATQPRGESAEAPKSAWPPTYNCSGASYHLPACGGTCGEWPPEVAAPAWCVEAAERILRSEGETHLDIKGGIWSKGNLRPKVEFWAGLIHMAWQGRGSSEPEGE